ncbi:hypothetical protein CPC08DRAFT_788815 [Agrocybe pediades]|nr:hypothetical protein CPC08DRAFT_788815 [Agrocybe pediades]
MVWDYQDCKARQGLCRFADDIDDIKRARMLFDSLVKSNPKHVPGWIAAACLEEYAGKMVARERSSTALRVRMCGCHWWRLLEYMYNNKDAKILFANLVQHIEQSSSNTHQRRTAVSTLNPSLQTLVSSLPAPSKSSHSPSSFGLPSPDSNLQTRHCRLFVQEACPSFKSAEQRNKELAIVYKTSGGTVGDIRRHQVLLTRGQWLNEAERLDLWVNDAEAAEAKGRIGYRWTPSSNTSSWTRALTSVFWSMAAMETWLDGDVPAARPVLERAFAVWMEYSVFKNQQSQTLTALKSLPTALERFRKTHQIYEAASNISAARSSFATGIKVSKPTYLMNIGVHLERELSG